MVAGRFAVTVSQFTDRTGQIQIQSNHGFDWSVRELQYIFNLAFPPDFDRIFPRIDQSAI